MINNAIYLNKLKKKLLNILIKQLNLIEES